MEHPLHIPGSMDMVISQNRKMDASDSLPSHQGPPKHQTILLVEDQPDLRQLLKRILEIKGYTCLEAKDGREALSILQQHPSIGLILSDYFMPGMDGLQLLQAFRQNPMNRKIPFILVTANWSDQLRHQALCEGAFAILAKPYLHDELFQLLEQGISPQAA